MSFSPSTSSSRGTADHRVLALDTSTPTLVTGLVHTLADGSSDATENTVENTRAHNELLMPTIFQLLESSGSELHELTAIAVGCGPGPFSGLRVGMATASGLGHALQVPVYGVCSHDAIAWRAQQASASAEEHLLVATDARRRETYWATYRGAQRVTGPEVGPAEILQPEVSRVLANPTVAARLPDRLRALAQQEEVPAVPSARGLVAVADFAVAPQPLTPLYLRRPDAKVPAAKPVSAALRWAEQNNK
ncbi:tRNA (adenosine(37)-N6)-threonylcarbamoyltransferase complex dimerization subunit type 1 TsaB [Corynebacterium pseudodiphtheriticum]|uniref:tRNA (adenosine(37)-N6)-threonylcarbamoyltransferase complex dimerization subunit type 1 TsaB n=1 Tax=Corynebacterium pseudodiphtheriticum TaxID=37637 RepID=UPI00254DDE47|nr:tRNA (adenosine(37)-N6)-threonylcarbamoyltransferase complex dimerization subunit type 1 TsaB [Corynebacterium pseudodiphtheriticum]MDK8717620.1 tRNA (adenosine(37)-N6)-threonylcarbamoyltransferase complex dimerization subunit type 1 TsaB [Corynebacterium pseudodiphtheriticum]